MNLAFQARLTIFTDCIECRFVKMFLRLSWKYIVEIRLYYLEGFCFGTANIIEESYWGTNNRPNKGKIYDCLFGFW